MVKNALFCSALVFTGMIGAALGLGANYASAADDCITESNLVPPKGNRWYYHIDRATNRKCWHIAPIAAAPAAAHPQRASARSEPGQTARGNHQLSESERAALFQDFLRWKEQQSAMNSRAGEP
jgi:hypothetical protein